MSNSPAWTRPRRRRVQGLRESGWRRQPQRRSHGFPARGPASSVGPGRDGQFFVRLWPRGGQSSHIMLHSGDGDVFIAGGVEGMSRAHFSMPRGRQPSQSGQRDHLGYLPGLAYPNPKMEQLFPLEAMGCTGHENIVDRMDTSLPLQPSSWLGLIPRPWPRRSVELLPSRTTPACVALQRPTRHRRGGP